MRIFDENFKKNPKNYILQSLLALAAMLVILSFVEILTRTAIVAALGASTFIVFAMPNSRTASPRRLIGGHIVGIICGLACYYLFNGGLLLNDLADNYDIITWFSYALSVVLSLFVMTVTDTEHPPAASTALGIAAFGVSWQIVVFVISFAIFLSLARRLLKPWLKDLIN
jgi:CBS-domain-containing membrane protein